MGIHALKAHKFQIFILVVVTDEAFLCCQKHASLGKDGDKLQQQYRNHPCFYFTPRFLNQGKARIAIGFGVGRGPCQGESWRGVKAGLSAMRQTQLDR